MSHIGLAGLDSCCGFLSGIYHLDQDSKLSLFRLGRELDHVRSFASRDLPMAVGSFCLEVFRELLELLSK